MGQFSWFTQDTNRRIVIGNNPKVVMADDKGNKYIVKKRQYEGYGVFGGKDYYVLLAEMNGHNAAEFDGDIERLRLKGIELAFEGDPQGCNQNILHPSLTESGKYMGGKPPKRDPKQGFIDFYCDEEWDD